MRHYRLDTFVVPNRSLNDFLQRVDETHTLLQAQPGFIQDLILEEPERPEATRVVTLVEWIDEAAMQRAGEAVRAMRKTSDFDPHAFMVERGIEADMRVYGDRQSRHA